MLKWMIDQGYGDRRTLERRIAGMEAWLADPQLLGGPRRRVRDGD